MVVVVVGLVVGMGVVAWCVSADDISGCEHTCSWLAWVEALDNALCGAAESASTLPCNGMAVRGLSGQW